MHDLAKRQVAHVREWERSAHADRKAMEVLQGDAETRVPAIFHAQQAVEKMLKGLLVAHGVTPEDSHDVGRLINQLDRVDKGTAAQVQVASRLTVHAVSTRYPPRVGRPPRALTDAQVQLDIGMARTVCDTLGRAIEDRVAKITPVHDGEDDKRSGPKR